MGHHGTNVKTRRDRSKGSRKKIRGVSTMKGLNIDLTNGQYSMLYDSVVKANPVDADPNFDVQTYDNLLDAICKATVTYLK